MSTTHFSHSSHCTLMIISCHPFTMSSTHWWFWVLTVLGTKQVGYVCSLGCTFYCVHKACTRCQAAIRCCWIKKQSTPLCWIIAKLCKAPRDFEICLKPWVNSELPVQEEGPMEGVSSLVTGCLREKIDFWSSFMFQGMTATWMDNRKVIGSLSRKLDKNSQNYWNLGYLLGSKTLYLLERCRLENIYINIFCNWTQFCLPCSSSENNWSTERDLGQIMNTDSAAPDCHKSLPGSCFLLALLRAQM